MPSLLPAGGRQRAGRRGDGIRQLAGAAALGSDSRKFEDSTRVRGDAIELEGLLARRGGKGSLASICWRSWSRLPPKQAR